MFAFKILWYLLTGTFLSSCTLYFVRKCGLLVTFMVMKMMLRPQNVAFETIILPAGPQTKKKLQEISYGTVTFPKRTSSSDV